MNSSTLPDGKRYRTPTRMLSPLRASDISVGIGLVISARSDPQKSLFMATSFLATYETICYAKWRATMRRSGVNLRRTNNSKRKHNVVASYIKIIIIRG